MAKNAIFSYSRPKCQSDPIWPTNTRFAAFGSEIRKFISEMYLVQKLQMTQFDPKTSDMVFWVKNTRFRVQKSENIYFPYCFELIYFDIRTSDFVFLAVNTNCFIQKNVSNSVVKNVKVIQSDQENTVFFFSKYKVLDQQHNFFQILSERQSDSALINNIFLAKNVKKHVFFVLFDKNDQKTSK